MDGNFVKDKNGSEKFEAFELVKLMNRGAKLIDGSFDKKFPLVCGAGFRIKGRFNLNKLYDAINRAYADIDTMRAFINMEDPDDLYFKVRKEYEFKAETIEIEGDDADSKYENAKKDVQEKVFQRETYADVGCKFLIYNLGEKDIFLVVLVEHGLIDGQALLLMIKKIFHDYMGLPGGGKIHKKGLVDFYNAYEKFKSEGTMKANTAYWEEMAKGTENLYTFRKPLDNNSISDEEKLLRIPMKTLKAACKNYKTTTANLVISAYQLAIAKTYGVKETVISCVSGNRTVPDFFESVVLQLDCMLLRNSVSSDETNVGDYFKQCMRTMSEGMSHCPSFYSQIPYSRFLFSYAANLFQGADPSKMLGIDITAWMPESIPEHVFDENYIFLIAFEQKNEVELHFAVYDKLFNREDFLSIAGGMVKIIDILAEKKGLNMRELADELAGKIY